MNSLTIEELQETRSASEFYTWVKKRIDLLAETDEGKSDLRLRKGLCKELLEELLPIGLLCNTFFNMNPMVEITPVLGNQNYDALVRDKRQEPVNFSRLEVTQAHEGEDAHLRMLYLEKHGHVSLTGKVNKQGTKKTGLDIEVENVAELHVEILSEQIKQICSAIKLKMAKNYNSGTGLLVIFVDGLAIQGRDDCELVAKQLEKKKELLMKKFSWVGVLGLAGRCFEYIGE
jgi:hypothetical protein